MKLLKKNDIATTLRVGRFDIWIRSRAWLRITPFFRLKPLAINESKLYFWGPFGVRVWRRK